MDKRYGASQRNDCLMRIGRNKWELIYGYGSDGNTGWNWRQRFSYKPTSDEIKSIVTEQINANTEEKICSGFEWNGKKVWLSTENQFNYKAAYDRAVQTQGVNLPVTFKLGTDVAPEYYEFTTVEDLSDFYTKALAYIQEVLSEGWKEKDTLDMSKFVTDE